MIQLVAFIFIWIGLFIFSTSQTALFQKVTHNFQQRWKKEKAS